jgi:polysaccharide deacetylase 2 family uncharacterized protein YibQ
MAHMTKRKIGIKRGKSSKGGPGYRKGRTVLSVLSFAVVSGFTLAVAYDSRAYDEVRRTSFSELALRLPDGLKDVHFNPPQVSAPIRLGEWPSWFIGRNEETRSKSDLRSRPVIAVVIDDLGNDSARTKEAIALPSKITLSFLPYPVGSHALSHEAHLAGHEVMVHLSMQPLGAADPGPMALRTDLAPAELARRVAWALERVSDYDGANNHMGSSFTASRTALVPVMQELAAHGMFFLDSRTTASTQAEEVARETGLLTGARDVFLDDDERAVAVSHQLKVVEERARANGSAIAIGHPHPETLAALKTWAAGLEKDGFRLASADEVLQMRTGNGQKRVASSNAR